MDTTKPVEDSEENIATAPRMLGDQTACASAANQNGSSESTGGENNDVVEKNIRKEFHEKASDSEAIIRSSQNAEERALDGVHAALGSRRLECTTISSNTNGIKISKRNASQNNDRAECQDQPQIQGATGNAQNDDPQYLLFPSTSVLAPQQPHSNGEESERLLEESEGFAIPKNAKDGGISRSSSDLEKRRRTSMTYFMNEPATKQLQEPSFPREMSEIAERTILDTNRSKTADNSKLLADLGNKCALQLPTSQGEGRDNVSTDMALILDREQYRKNGIFRVGNLVNMQQFSSDSLTTDLQINRRANENSSEEPMQGGGEAVSDVPQNIALSYQDATVENTVVISSTIAVAEYLNPKRTTILPRHVRQSVYRHMTDRSEGGTELSRLILMCIQEYANPERHVVLPEAQIMYRNMMQNVTRLENEYCAYVGDEWQQGYNQLLESSTSQTFARSPFRPVVGNIEDRNQDLQHPHPPMSQGRENEPEKRDASPARNCRRDHLPIPETDSARQNHNARNTRTMSRNNTDEQILQATDEPDSETPTSSRQGLAGGNQVLPLANILAIEFMDFGRTTILPSSVRNSIYQSVINGSEGGSEVARMALKIVCEFNNRRRRVVLPASGLMYRRILERFTNPNQTVQNDVDEQILYTRDEPESETEALSDQCQAGYNEVSFMPQYLLWSIWTLEELQFCHPH